MSEEMLYCIKTNITHFLKTIILFFKPVAASGVVCL